MAKSEEETIWAEEDMSRCVSCLNQLLEHDGANLTGAIVLYHL